MSDGRAWFLFGRCHWSGRPTGLVLECRVEPFSPPLSEYAPDTHKHLGLFSVWHLGDMCHTVKKHVHTVVISMRAKTLLCTQILLIGSWQIHLNWPQSMKTEHCSSLTSNSLPQRAAPGLFSLLTWSVVVSSFLNKLAALWQILPPLRKTKTPRSPTHLLSFPSPPQFPPWC